ncbi:hypothetical protein ACROYT_G027878 [Oculina patagonica]
MVLVVDCGGGDGDVGDSYAGGIGIASGSETEMVMAVELVVLVLQEVVCGDAGGSEGGVIGATSDTAVELLVLVVLAVDCGYGYSEAEALEVQVMWCGGEADGAAAGNSGADGCSGAGDDDADSFTVDASGGPGQWWSVVGGIGGCGSGGGGNASGGGNSEVLMISLLVMEVITVVLVIDGNE